MIKSKKTLWGMFSRKLRESQANHEGYIVCPGCYRSYPWEETDCGHFIENTERKKDYGGNELWYDVRNFRAQCVPCNRFSAATAKRVWTADFIAEHGEEQYREMVELKNKPKKWTPEEVMEVINSIQV